MGWTDKQRRGMMELHAIGLGATFLLLFFAAFMAFGLWLMYFAIKILNDTFQKRSGQNVFFVLYFMIAYSLIGVLLRQAINLKLIFFTSPNNEIYFNFIYFGAYIVIALYALNKVLRAINKIERT